MPAVTRRNVLVSAAALAAGGAAYLALGGRPYFSPTDIATRRRLSMPPLMDATETGTFDLTSQSGTTEFFAGRSAETIGFNQPFLGPVVRMMKGPLRPTVVNGLSWPISAHWHGLLVPGIHDGGPHLAIRPGKSWTPDMQISQEPCTAFFHTHVHGRTARDVYAGLVGAIHVVDGKDAERALPTDYGVDDLTLILQDRRFSDSGEFEYANSMMDIRHGMTGDTILVNGQARAVAVVPKAIVRLRLINGSNARIYRLFCDDKRPMHLIATDGGFLPAPTSVEELRLSPGERAEVLIDFSDGSDMTLASGGDPNEGMGAMMGRAREMLEQISGARQFPVLPFVVDDRLATRITSIPDELGGTLPDLHTLAPTAVRRFSLDMGMGMGMGMMGGGATQQFAINGRPFDMDRIDQRIKLGSTERWIISSDMLVHPFHVHGASFQTVSENGGSPRPESRGWKDTVVIDRETELLIRFDHPAAEESPFMYHCHILEHEDGGMMGQFTVG